MTGMYWLQLSYIMRYRQRSHEAVKEAPRHEKHSIFSLVTLRTWTQKPDSASLLRHICRENTASSGVNAKPLHK